MYGVNPAYFHKTCYNAAYVSQTPDFDYDILMKYDGKWDKLKYIILPLSYCTLTEQLKTIDEDWRIKNYLIYYHVGKASKASQYLEITDNMLIINIKKLFKYYIKHQDLITCENNGWINKEKDPNIELDDKGKAAKRHTRNDPQCVAENTSILKRLIEYAQKRNIQVIFITTPTYKSYYENLVPSQLNLTVNTGKQFAKEYNNVSYYDFLSDSTFTDDDFYNSNHLDVSGAKKLSCKLDSIIKTISQGQCSQGKNK